MFTFKKIALLGAAGLAALSMSCSDPADDPEAGGSWTTAFGAAYDGDKTISLAGVATASPEGNTIASVGATVGGVSFASNEIGGLTVGTASVNFAGAYVGVPASLCAEAGTKNLKVEVTVTFVSGEPLKGSADVTVTCSGAGPVTIPIKTLQVGGTSTTLGSFIDLDEPKAYLSAAAKQNPSIINLVYTVSFKDEDGDGLGDNIFTAPYFAALADPAGGYSVLTTTGYIVPLEAVATADEVAAAKTLLTTQTSVPEAAIGPYAALFAGDFTDKIDTEIPAATTSVFVAKGNSGIYLVAVKAKNGTTDITLAILKLTE